MPTLSPEDAEERYRVEGERFDRILEPCSGLVEFLLKSHLLIEEKLNGFLQAGLVNPAALRDARLSFSQTLKLVHALTGDLFPDELVEFIERLNALRNRVAHEAEPLGLEARLLALDPSALPCFKSEADLAALPTGLPRLRLAIRFVYGFLSGLHRGYEIMRQHGMSPPSRAQAGPPDEEGPV